MDESIFELSLTNGGLQLTDAQPETKFHWREAQLQDALALNPDLLGVTEHIPLFLDGGTTSFRPDQVYLDELGRLVVVEIKNETAGLKALAQLMSYAEHWRTGPLGELESGFANLLARGCNSVQQEALERLRAWADPDGVYDASSRPAAAEMWKVWPRPGVASLRSFALTSWGDHALSLSGALKWTPSFGQLARWIRVEPARA